MTPNVRLIPKSCFHSILSQYTTSLSLRLILKFTAILSMFVLSRSPVHTIGFILIPCVPVQLSNYERNIGTGLLVYELELSLHHI